MFHYNSTEVYIWNSQSLAPTIICLNESLVNDASKQIEQCKEQKEKRNMLLTEEKQMNKRIKRFAVEELGILQKILEKISCNYWSKQYNCIEVQLDIDKGNPEEEDKSANRFIELLQSEY